MESEQAEYAHKQDKRQAQRDAGKKLRGKPPQAPQPGPKDADQINLTDEQSRIMPVAGGGFDQCYNAQAAVDTQSMLIVSAALSQAPNDKRELIPMLDKLNALPQALGQANEILADTGYFSAANTTACTDQNLIPYIAQSRQSHHQDVFERFAPDPHPPQDNDPVTTMGHRLKTQAGRAVYALRKQTVEPVFGIIKHIMGFRQFLLRGADKVRSEWSLVTLAWNIKRMNVLRWA